ncbi:MAG: cytochrome c3 family protein [Pseudomonadota bacterium]|nr:cytochrome c3 family protein [Pseudomonadota bacterium]
MFRNPPGKQTVLLAALVVASLSHGTRAQQVTADQEVQNNFAMHSPPTQPVPYSHKTHLALGLACEACHANAEQGVHMGFPETSTCMRCHNSIATDQQGVAELTRISASGGQIPWVRVYQVLPGVTWAHQPHIEAGVQCEACHGDVSQLEIMAMTTSVTSMASCISCHQVHEANTTCQTCHAWPTE